MQTQLTNTAVEMDMEYQVFERLIAQRVAEAKGPLFTTDATGLWEAYLEGIPAEHRQHYNCVPCRRFVERFGGLVTIDLGGYIHPFLFDGFRDDVWPTYFKQPSMNLTQRVIGTLPRNTPAKVNGVFINSETTWGTPFNVPGPGSKTQGQRWTHLHGIPQERFKSLTKTADQVMAEKLEDFGMLCRGLAEIPVEATVQAVRVLEADAVDRSEKTLGVAKWLLALQQRLFNLGQGVRKGTYKGGMRNNLIWLAVATAPPGFCHVRSTMISTLLDDVIAGLDFEVIKRRWADKMHPLQYQRPTTLKEGNVKQANELIAKLGAEGSLQRRFAKKEDVLKWEWKKPVKAEEPTAGKTNGGAFDHLLKPKNKIKPVELPPQNLTLEKFKELLPTFISIEVRVPSCGGFYGLVTAVNPESPPIIQWDGLTISYDVDADTPIPHTEALPRNPVSWFFYHGGSSAPQWNLIGGSWEEVAGIHLSPPHWQQPEKFKHQGKEVFLTITKAKNLNHLAGGGLFPESMRSEFHSIRQAIEAHSRHAKIEGAEEGDANGIALSNQSLRLRTKDLSGNVNEWEVIA